MVKPEKTPTAASNLPGTKVTRITASDPLPTKKVASARQNLGPDSVKISGSPLKSAGGYFKGAWYELKQVRWPDRGATWSMTGALLGFTAFFVVFILLLDALFKYLFKLIIG